MFSITTSLSAASRFKSSTARGSFALSVMPSLPWLIWWNIDDISFDGPSTFCPLRIGRPASRVLSGRPPCSTLITRAPNSARMPPTHGADHTHPRSSTRNPASGLSIVARRRRVLAVAAPPAAASIVLARSFASGARASSILNGSPGACTSLPPTLARFQNPRSVNCGVASTSANERIGEIDEVVLRRELLDLGHRVLRKPRA